MGSEIFLLSPLCFRRVNAFKGGFARFSICVWCIDVCTFRERNYNRAIRLRSALQQNLIAFTVMALASENYHWKRVEEDGGDRRGKEENKISERVYSVFRSTLENIIEYHRMFSNLLSYVSACVHAQKLFSPSFLSLSPFLFFPNIHAEISLHILLNIFRNCAVKFDPGCQFEIENPIRGINNDNSRRVAGHGRSGHENSETSALYLPTCRQLSSFFPWQLSQFRRVSFKINRESYK